MRCRLREVPTRPILNRVQGGLAALIIVTHEQIYLQNCEASELKPGDKGERSREFGLICRDCPRRCTSYQICMTFSMLLDSFTFNSLDSRLFAVITTQKLQSNRGGR